MPCVACLPGIESEVGFVGCCGGEGEEREEESEGCEDGRKHLGSKNEVDWGAEDVSLSVSFLGNGSRDCGSEALYMSSKIR